jgi:hypothetical protein
MYSDNNYFCNYYYYLVSFKFWSKTPTKVALSDAEIYGGNIGIYLYFSTCQLYIRLRQEYSMS